MSEDVSGRTRILPFGIGCLTFDYRPDSTFSTIDWVRLVEQTLLSIPSVDAVEVDPGDHPEHRWSSEAVTGPDHTNARFPTPIGAVVRFNVTIPRRLHRSIHDGLEHPSEKFSVETRYEWYGPMTFVVCEDRVGLGSSAVILVREFIEQEVSNRAQSKDLTFCTLGPSPFHVDFLLAPSDGETWEVKEFPSPGYDDVLYLYPSSEWESTEHAMRNLMDELSQEFSLFYDLQLRRNQRFELSSRLTSATGDLVDAHQRRGLRGWFSRLFLSSGRARSLGVSALAAKVSAEEDDQYAQDALGQTYSGAYPLARLRARVEAIANETFDTSTRSALDVVEFLEAGRTKEFEVAVVAVATLTGGIAGAIASWVSR